MDGTSERVSVVIAEYLRRRDAGEVVERQQLLDSYPELANELRRFFANEAAIDALASQPQPPERKRDTLHAGDAGDSVPTSHEPLRELPAEFGRYRVLKVLGQGAMGAVYLAYDTALDRNIALKTPKLNAAESPEVVERFEREARAAATLHHRNICPVFDVGEIDGVRYLTMAYIDGKPLSEMISETVQLSERQAAIAIRKLAGALELAHRAGVIHRDLKPDNVMVDKAGEPVIMDFGLARRAENRECTRLTQVGTIMGSPAYMSPEQVSGAPDAVGHQSDIYSLGVILFELLTGQLPFQGGVPAVFGQILTTDPPDLEQVRPGVDTRLASVCRKMMAKTTRNRYQSMQEVVDALSDILRNRQPPKEVSDSGCQPLPAGQPVIASSEDHSLLHRGAVVATRSPAGLKNGDHTPGDTAIGRRANADSGNDNGRFFLRWTLAGFGGLLLLGGVTVFFKGGRVEVADGSTVKVSQDGERTILEVSPPVADAAPDHDVASTILTSDAWKWVGPVAFLNSRTDPAEAVAAAYSQLTDVDVRCRVYESGDAPHRDLMIIDRNGADWSAPRSVGGAINTPGDEASPFVTADGLTLVFESDRPGGHGETDLWMSQRGTLDDAFSAPVNLGANVNSQATEGRATLSGDGLTLIFASNRVGSSGPSDLWICQRATVHDAWSPAKNMRAPVNSSSRELGPVLTSDGLVLIFTSDRRGGVGGADIWMSERSSVNDMWSVPVNLGPGINSRKWDSAPWLSPDGRALLVNTEGAGQQLFRRVPASSERPMSDWTRRPHFSHLLTGRWVPLMEELQRRAGQVPGATPVNDGGLMMEHTGFVIDWMPARDAIIRAHVKKLSVEDHPGLRLRFLHPRISGSDLPHHWYATYLGDWNRFGIGRQTNRDWVDFDVKRIGRHDDFFEWTLAVVGDQIRVYVDGREILSGRDRMLSHGYPLIYSGPRAVFRNVELMVLDETPAPQYGSVKEGSLIDIHPHPIGAIWTQRISSHVDDEDVSGDADVAPPGPAMPPEERAGGGAGRRDDSGRT